MLLSSLTFRIDSQQGVLLREQRLDLLKSLERRISRLRSASTVAIWYV